MRIAEKEEFAGGVILAIQGDVVGGPHADDFYRTIQDLIDRGQTTVLIDLAKAKRANSSGLGILIRGYAALKKAGGSMRIYNLSEHLDHMFKITRFNSILDVYATEAEAKAGQR